MLEEILLLLNVSSPDELEETIDTIHNIYGRDALIDLFQYAMMNHDRDTAEKCYEHVISTFN